MKAFIVGEVPALAGAFKQYFSQRDHSISCVDIDQPKLLPCAEIDEPCSIVIADCGGQLGDRMLAISTFQRLVDECSTRGWPLLMLSDSRVFAAVRNQRYRERDVTAPTSAAGEQLLQYERYLAENSERHIILRTGPLLAPTGNNLLTYLVQQLLVGGTIPAAVEPRFCPTGVADLTRVVAGICDQIDCAAQCWGVYHYHSSDPATYYEFAEVVLAAASQYWKLGENVHLIVDAAESRGSEYPILSCQKIRDTFGIQQLQWRKAIADLLKQIQANKTK